MKLPSPVLATRNRYVAAFPLWSMPVDPNDPASVAAAENRARTWTLGLVAQIVFEFPGSNYGSKRASPTRPLSKDGIAQQLGPQILVWDMLSGAGTGSPTLTSNPDSEDISSQIFEIIIGRDVIGDGVPEPGPSPPQPPVNGNVIPYDEQKSIQFGLACNDVYNESHAPMDPGMIAVHSSRAAYDFYTGGLSWEASFHKHVNEFRAVYGLPPV